MKISVVTAVYNRSHCIAAAIKSVQQQSYTNIEHVIVDGASTDGTLEILRGCLNKDSILISEPDNGIYDALNKGFLRASGDVIGILHSDDSFYDDKVIERVMKVFRDYNIDYVYGDIDMINGDDKVVRHWRAGHLDNGFIKSMQIPHPSLFISRSLLMKLHPPFDSSYKISADLKQQLTFANKLRSKGFYLPYSLVKMRVGGTSTSNFRAYLDGWIESRRAWNEVHGNGGFLYVIRKVLSKISGIRT